MNTLERNTETLVSDLKRVVRDSEALVQATTGVAGDKAHEIRERLAETLDTARQTCRALEDKTVQSAKAADQIVRSHPYESISVALGIGVILGALLIRR